MTQKSKTAIAQRLIVTIQNAKHAELTLIQKGEAQAAKKLEQKTKALTKQVDKLIQSAMKDWLNEADELATQVKSMNARIKTLRTKIANDIKRAENAVKLIGLVDDVISLVDTIVP